MLGKQNDSGVPELHLGAFGKHPGWNDHIDDPGLETQRLVDFKTLVYVEGVATAIDSGRWDALDAESRVEGFGHVLVMRTRGDLVLARLWSSSDGKGRTKYPMCAAVHVRGVGVEWAAENILPELESVQARCEQATTAAQVLAILDSARSSLRARGACGATGGAELTIPAGFVGGLADRPEMGPGGLGMCRVMYQLHREASMFEIGAKSPSRLGKTDQAPSIQLRLPAVQSGPGDGEREGGGGLLGCLRLLLTKLEPWTPMLLVASLKSRVVDVMLGEPQGAQLFCLQAGEKVLPLTTQIPYSIDGAFASQFEQWLAGERGAPAREIPRSTESGRRTGGGRFAPLLLAGLLGAAIPAGVCPAQPTPPTVSQTEPRVRYNALLSDLKLAVMDSGTTDEQARAAAMTFLSEARALPGGIAFLGSVQATLDSIESALKNPEVGSTPSEALRLGPASTGVYAGSADGAIVRFKGTEGTLPELAFARVDMPGGESIYMATTECSVGQFNGIVGRLGDVFSKVLRSFDRISDPRPGPRSWEWADSTGKRGGIVPAKTWLARRSLTAPNDYPADAVPPAPSLESPIQHLSPAAALFAARMAGCRLPTSTEWAAANAKAKASAAGAKPNLRDLSWNKQWEFVRARQIAGGKTQLPDAGAFAPPGAKLSPLPDLGPKESDGTLWFTPVGEGSGGTIRNLVGNVAEYVLDVPAAEQPEPKPGATDRFLELHAAQIRVIGGSAISDPAIDPGQPQPLVLDEAKEGYADVGFRLCFSAGFAPGGGQSLASRINRLIEPLPTIP